MGILSTLKEKALQRQPPAPFSEDIKAHVLGEYPPPASAGPPPGAEEFAIPGPGPAPLPELPAPAGPVIREPLRREEKGVEYEILDRLALMEAQLSAIRAQVEVINERLKTIELGVGVRPRSAGPTRYF